MLHLPNRKIQYGHQSVLSLAPLVLLLFLTGCDQSISEQAGGPDIVLSVWISKNCFKEGDLLIFRATTTNKGSDTFVVELEDRPVFDLEIGYNLSSSTTNSQPVSIQWSDNKPLTSDLTRTKLEPGESKTIEIKLLVPDPPPPGVSLRAVLIDGPGNIDHPLYLWKSIYSQYFCAPR